MLITVWARADISWNFAQIDPQPGGLGGIYGYIYPKDSASRQSPFHSASLQRVGSATIGAAKLSFVLDGPKYPSAGFGLMFPESRPLDLRGLKAIRLHLSSDRPRTVRLSFASRLPVYQTASDTGVSYGEDLKATSTGQDWTIPVGNFSYPTWSTVEPDVLGTDVLGSTWAIQLNVSCEESGGKCAKDSGWVRLDSLRLIGVGLEWPIPTAGTCSGDSLDLSRFSSSSPKKNGLGGYWYAYTDLNAADSSSRGFSRVLSASDTSNPSSWLPDSVNNAAYLKFHLVRGGPYSGFAAVETQFGPPDGTGNPVSANLPGLRSVSFRLAFDSGFPSSLGGITLHAKKAGKVFANGQDHQVRIPLDSTSRRWCLDLNTLQQPLWSAWGQLPFTPDSLLAMTWDVKLPADATESVGGFRVSEVKLWTASASVRRTSLPVWSLRRQGSRLELTRPPGGGPLEALLLDVQGRIQSRMTGGETQTNVTIETPFHGPSWVRVHDDQGWRTFSVPPGP